MEPGYTRCLRGARRTASAQGHGGCHQRLTDGRLRESVVHVRPAVAASGASARRLQPCNRACMDAPPSDRTSHHDTGHDHCSNEIPHADRPPRLPAPRASRAAGVASASTVDDICSPPGMSAGQQALRVHRVTARCEVTEHGAGDDRLHARLRGRDLELGRGQGRRRRRLAHDQGANVDDGRRQRHARAAELPTRAARSPSRPRRCEHPCERQRTAAHRRRGRTPRPRRPRRGGNVLIEGVLDACATVVDESDGRSRCAASPSRSVHARIDIGQLEFFGRGDGSRGRRRRCWRSRASRSRATVDGERRDGVLRTSKRRRSADGRHRLPADRAPGDQGGGERRHRSTSTAGGSRHASAAQSRLAGRWQRRGRRRRAAALDVDADGADRAHRPRSSTCRRSARRASAATSPSRRARHHPDRPDPSSCRRQRRAAGDVGGPSTSIPTAPSRSARIVGASAATPARAGAVDAERLVRTDRCPPGRTIDTRGPSGEHHAGERRHA